ncbi:hypothetical protein E4191_05680 [Paracoccus liaowanqingii]|uniref:Uncharacterized protein n=1 Tax=Paracoccus liaowanqingii TaxID=2560053 RepID=A0A4P7HM87_9RHOB|nr:hypothetical protein [Paracoccus liaowanqingii]QBX34261.1 hypothetical protein E4191_05680 [Paracoccus liaowanqingii]
MTLPVTFETLQKMHRVAAALVVDDPIYLPIFERIEKELARMDDKKTTLERARAILASHKAAA